METNSTTPKYYDLKPHHIYHNEKVIITDSLIPILGGGYNHLPYNRYKNKVKTDTSALEM